MKPRDVHVSSFGLREGVYFELLPDAVRAEDQLLDACRRLEAAQARSPGFGEELFGFIAPIIVDWDKRDRRLAHAASLLNDVNWRAHPDYRAAGCFETLTRANLAGLDHRDRVFVAIALMNRYGESGRGAAGDALSLLTEDERLRARALGRALRLGAMLGGSTPDSLRGASLVIKDDAVTLDLAPETAQLSGWAVDRRLRALSDALSRAGDIPKN
jgi:exopolyphosphatase/guanosine-5'-triphosphate,3'-diphosphate pyrophosphatase